ncbi:MAG: polymer-forming cytoskeletal protein, partial [Pseudomonadota bacterium]|nr:polymer-forming cytoskeletal protein [Pseudomonadota bacterium]
MFNKSNATKTAAAAKPAAPSIVSADMVVSGNLKSKGDIQVDGTVEGDITSNKLTISAAASVRGMIEAEVVVIAGEVSGQIKARQV